MKLKIVLLNNYNKPNRVLEKIYYFSIISIALFMRLFELSNRSMHHDESMHAYYSWLLHEGFGLIHNPMLHGPFQMEITSLLFTIFGDNDFTARILYAIFGTLLVGMPFLFRKKLGTWGAVFTSLFLCFSPSMLYFSRFARNDIIMAAFTFGLVITIWNFFEIQKERYLLLISFLLALSFGTKESAFLVTAILIFYCLLKILNQIIIKVSSQIGSVTGWNIIQLFNTFIRTSRSEFKKGFKYTNIAPYSSIMILLATLTLPQWTSFSGIIQNTFILKWSNLVLVSEQGTIGMPEGAGTLLAIILTVSMLAISVFIGCKWNWRIWLKCAFIFYLTWLLIYTTGLTNFTDGVQSGIWQTLGYWIIQQGEGRGGQPEYYYLIMTALYEYLPLIITIIATVYHIKKPNRFSSFMIYWCLSTFLVYTIASEKMPWLLVNIALPMIVFSGYFTGFIFEKLITYKFKNKILLFIAISTVLLLIFSIRTAIVATFNNSDIPREMLVYTQTSPDLKKSLSIITQIDSQNNNIETPMYIDSTSGFTWPWAWYLRDRSNVMYEIYPNKTENISQKILIVNSSNYEISNMPNSTNLITYQKIPHRWWFPEHTYRNLSLSNFIIQNMHTEKIISAVQYWFNRTNIADKIGSEDFYIIYPDGFNSIDLISDKVRS